VKDATATPHPGFPRATRAVPWNPDGAQVAYRQQQSEVLGTAAVGTVALAPSAVPRLLAPYDRAIRIPLAGLQSLVGIGRR
jgi:hypothetical protein